MKLQERRNPLDRSFELGFTNLTIKLTMENGNNSGFLLMKYNIYNNRIGYFHLSNSMIKLVT